MGLVGVVSTLLLVSAPVPTVAQTTFDIAVLAAGPAANGMDCYGESQVAMFECFIVGENGGV